MSRFGYTDQYGDSDVTFYGDAPASAMSARPMHTRVFPGRVDLSWRTPTVPGIDVLRVRRSHVGYPVWEEDGTLVHEEIGSLSINSLSDTGVTPGRWAYYSVFVKISGGWRRVGKTEILVPGRVPTNTDLGPDGDPIILDDTHPLDQTLINLLPPVLTSSLKDAVGPPDLDSALFNFLSALAFTLEDSRTLLDRLLPDHGKLDFPPGLLPAAFASLGLPDESGLPIIDQKRLIREARHIYSMRGTALGLSAYVEALTGWASEITQAVNLTQSRENSSFAIVRPEVDGLGEWHWDTAEPPTGTSPDMRSVPITTYFPAISAAYLPKRQMILKGLTGRVCLKEWSNFQAQPDGTYLLQVKPNTQYTFSAYFNPTFVTQDAFTKHVGLEAKGFSTVWSGVTCDTTEWYHTITPEYVLPEAEWTNEEVPGPVESRFALITGSGWVRKHITFTTGPTIRGVALSIVWNAVAEGYFAVTGVCLQEGLLTDFTEPAVTMVEAIPTRTNLLTNPTFGHATPTQDWTYNAGQSWVQSAVTPPDVMATSSIKYDAAAGSGWFSLRRTLTGLEPGTYTFSASVKGLSQHYASAMVSSARPLVYVTSERVNWADMFSPISQAAMNGVDRLIALTGDPHQLSTGDRVEVVLPPGRASYLVSDVVSPTSFTIDTTTALAVQVDGVTQPIPQYFDGQSFGPEAVANGGGEFRATSDGTPEGTPRWYRHSVTFDVIESTDSVLLSVLADGGVLISACMLERAAFADTYFDGDSPWQYGSEWRGVAHASASDMYPGAVLKSRRLEDSLQEYLPLNGACRVVTQGGTLLASTTANEDRPLWILGRSRLGVDTRLGA